MPKMKTNSSAKKRFKVTGSGKVKRNKAFKSKPLNEIDGTLQLHMIVVLYMCFSFANDQTIIACIFWFRLSTGHYLCPH